MHSQELGEGPASSTLDGQEVKNEAGGHADVTKQKRSPQHRLTPLSVRRRKGRSPQGPQDRPHRAHPLPPAVCALCFDSNNLLFRMQNFFLPLSPPKTSKAIVELFYIAFFCLMTLRYQPIQPLLKACDFSTASSKLLEVIFRCNMFFPAFSPTSCLVFLASFSLPKDDRMKQGPLGSSFQCY